MYLPNDDDAIELMIGEIISYEDDAGDIVDGEVLEVIEKFNHVKVLPIDQLIRIPLWIRAEDIVSDDDIEFIVE